MIVMVAHGVKIACERGDCTAFWFKKDMKEYVPSMAYGSHSRANETRCGKKRSGVEITVRLFKKPLLMQETCFLGLWWKF